MASLPAPGYFLTMKSRISRPVKIKSGLAARFNRSDKFPFGTVPSLLAGDLDLGASPYWPHPPEVVGRRTW
jgi:hypothetical protein